MPSHNNIEGVEAFDLMVTAGLKLRAIEQTLAGTYTMAAGMPVVHALDPGGAGRNVLLPPEDNGLVHVIVNLADAAEDLTIKDDSNTNTIGTVSQSEIAILICASGAWRICVGKTT